ncbi:MAG: hypothetical protein LAP21_22170 [Acidobacteriia bacterium]|nr:hypothetical protein [Terriglobia bacterium]
MQHDSSRFTRQSGDNFGGVIPRMVIECRISGEAMAIFSGFPVWVVRSESALSPLKHTSFFLRIAFLIALFPYVAQTQEALQFNVPYHCPDGTDKIITQCKPWGRGEVCSWRNERNGQLINEQYNVRSQMDGWLAICKVQKPASATASASAANATQATRQPPPSLVATPSGRIAAGLKPPYLNNLPSVETVKKQIQGTDATDTLERQVAMFMMLGAIIQHHLAADRSRRDLTPDEQKVTYAYNLAAYEIEERYKKTHSVDEAQAFARRHGQYEMDAAMHKELNAKLLSAEAVEENRQNDRSALEQLQAHNERIRRQNEEAKATAEAAANGTSTDPVAVSSRRCLELGGNALECVGKGMGEGFKAMLGIYFDALKGPERTGLVIAGAYVGANKLQLSFTDNNVQISGCGVLLATPHNYTVAKRGDVLAIQVANAPRPFTVVLGPDGNFAGPGATDITGNIIVGYRHYTEYTRRVSDNQIVAQRPVSEPILGTKVEHCVVAALRSTGPVVGGSAMALLGAALGDTSSKDQVKTYSAGPRIVGTYGNSSGLTMQFAPEGVVMDCGPAHVARTYRVENSAAALRVTIDNAGAPIALTLQADGTLAGSGSADVVGRIVSGTAQNGDVTFRPARASCPVGTLSPRQRKSSAGL